MLQSLARSPTPCDVSSIAPWYGRNRSCNLWREAPPLATSFPIRAKHVVYLVAISGEKPHPLRPHPQGIFRHSLFSCNLWREAPPLATMYYCPGCAIDREMLQSLARSPTPCDRMAA